MNPTTSPVFAPFRRYTTTLAILNILCLLAAVLCIIGAIVMFCTSYVFNDSGNVPQAVAPFVHFLWLDALIFVVLFVWQLRVRKHLFAMQPNARTSMIALGIAYIVIAIIHAMQFWILAILPAAIGIWWLVVFSSSSTRDAFETAAIPNSEA